MTEEQHEHKNENQDEEIPNLEDFKLTAENYPDVKVTLLYFIQAVSNHAYVYLGLFPIPGTSDTIFKLDEAKRAIDLLEVLIEQIKPMLTDSAEKREFDGILTQLRMNYVSKSQKNTEKPKEAD